MNLQLQKPLPKHIFSMTCKVDTVLDHFTSNEGRIQALEWFHRHHIRRIFLETYRHRRYADASILREQRDFFRAAGLEVAGCITTTQMSQRTATWPITTCFTDPVAHRFLQEVVERTAGLFDLFILDDFFFTTCTCPACEEARERRGKSWDDFRCDLMMELAQQRVLDPARAVNPKVQVIIKYPLWHEKFRGNGYDVVRESALFDLTWAGTETREPDSPEAGRRPQTAASWIQGWINDLSGGTCGGAWYDPIDTTPETFVEQARQSIIGGARESLLHCYDYLATTTPGLAIHGKDTEIRHGLADAAAFRAEADGLQRMAETLSGMRPYGVLVPKQPNHDAQREAYLPGFVGMLGIPAVAAASLTDAQAAFLGAQASSFSNAEDYVTRAARRGSPILLTHGFLTEIGPEARHRLQTWLPTDSDNPLAGVGGPLAILRCPEDLWDLTRLDPTELDTLRNWLLQPFGIAFHAPTRVSLHLFAADGVCCEVIENFTNTPVEATLSYSGTSTAPRILTLALPAPDSASLASTGNHYTLMLAPRSLALLRTGKDG